MHEGRETNIYINIDRIKSETENFRKLRDELKQKQEEIINLNIRYVIKQNS